MRKLFLFAGLAAILTPPIAAKPTKKTPAFMKPTCVIHAVFRRFAGNPRLRDMPRPTDAERIEFFIPAIRPYGLKPSPCLTGDITYSRAIRGIDGKTAARLKKGVFISVSPGHRLLSIYGESLVKKEKGRIWMKRLIRSRGSMIDERSRRKVVRRLFAKYRGLASALRKSDIRVYWRVRRETRIQPPIAILEYILIDPDREKRAMRLGYRRAAAPKYK